MRQSLLAFWDDQLRFRIDGTTCHIAYPLLAPDGWQIAFSLQCIMAPVTHFRLTDNGRTMQWLDDCCVSGRNAMAHLEERCKFLELSRDGRELVKVSAKPFTPEQIELFAEGLQAIAYLYYRAEPHSFSIGVVRTTFENVLRAGNLKLRSESSLAGKLIPQIHFDYVVQSHNLTACKLFERKTDLKQNLEMWGFRFYDLHERDPAVRRLIVYNHEVGRWDDDTMTLGAGICDEFIPFNDGSRILRCLEGRAA